MALFPVVSWGACSGNLITIKLLKTSGNTLSNASPNTVYMQESDRTLYKDDNCETVFTRLDTLPSSGNFVFQGFILDDSDYSDAIYLISASGEVVSGSVNMLPTNNLTIKVRENWGWGTTCTSENGGIMLKCTCPGNGTYSCGSRWACNNNGSLSFDTGSFVAPTCEGYIFTGYYGEHDVYQPAPKFINADGTLNSWPADTSPYTGFSSAGFDSGWLETCPVGKYFNGSNCINCPANPNLTWYEFTRYGNSTDITSCAIKLKLGGGASKCAEGTNVVYQYYQPRGAYVNKIANVVTGPCKPEEATDKCILRKAVDPTNFYTDYCEECAVGTGAYYEDAEHRCRTCPNLDGGIGLDGDNTKLYNFVSYDDTSRYVSLYDNDGGNDFFYPYIYNAVYAPRHNTTCVWSEVLTGYWTENCPNTDDIPISCYVSFNHLAQGSSCSDPNMAVLYAYNFSNGTYDLDSWGLRVTGGNDCHDADPSCFLPTDYRDLGTLTGGNSGNVDKDLCSVCNFAGNYKGVYCPLGPVSCTTTNGSFEYCAACPAADLSSGLYEFVFSGDNSSIANCQIKLKFEGTNGSKCGVGTNVVYRYNESNYSLYDTDTRQFLSSVNGVISKIELPANNCTGNHPCYAKVLPANTTFDPGHDFCDTCNVGSGWYIDDAGVCKACPEQQTINTNNYDFIQYGDGTGITSCAIKLKVGSGSLSGCATGTNVVYHYDEHSRSYKLSENNLAVATCNPSTTGGTCNLFDVGNNPIETFDNNREIKCVSCNVGNGSEYEDKYHTCQSCPDMNGNIGLKGSDKLYTFVPYNSHSTHQSADGYSPFDNHKDSCVVELNVAKSLCDSGTDVQYIYKFNLETPGYELSAAKRTVSVDPCTGNSNNCHFTRNVIPSILDDATYDLCYVCNVGNGSYIDNNSTCELCPSPGPGTGGTKQCVESDCGGLYNFDSKNGGFGITSCALKLNLEKSKCGGNTEVVYVYDSGSKLYVRQGNYEVYNGLGPVFSTDALPSSTELKDYCSDLCNNGYWLSGDGCSSPETSSSSSLETSSNCKCESCTAGYWCPVGSGNIYDCSNNPLECRWACQKNTYSLTGATSCIQCKGEDVTTMGSEYCADSENGRACYSSMACGIREIAKLCTDSNCTSEKSISFAGLVEVLLTNRSVIKKAE